MQIEIKITGSGTAQEVVTQLRQIADDVEVGNYINALNEDNICVWEGEILMVEIK
jgi:hypothetical protein